MLRRTLWVAAGNTVRAADKANNTLLMAEFRRQMDELTLTTGKRYLLTAFTPADPAKIAVGWEMQVFRYLDFANVQGYDLHGSGSDNSWESNRTGHRQAANRAAPGQFQEDAGTRGYANLLAMVPGCTVLHDLQSISTYCFTGNGGQWWSFDDTWSIRQKTSWLRSKGLLGAMVWEMSGDTPADTLLTALHNGLSS